MPKRRYKWDLFASHNRLAKPWVREFVRQWRELGLSVFFDEDSIEPGEDIVAGIERGLSHSRRIALFITPAALNSRWVALETSLAVSSDPDAASGQVIPIILEPIEESSLRPTIRRLSWIDLTDASTRTERYRHLLRHLGVDSPVELPAVPPNQGYGTHINVSMSSTFIFDLKLCGAAIRALRTLGDIGLPTKPLGMHLLGLSPQDFVKRIRNSSAHILAFTNLAAHPSTYPFKFLPKEREWSAKELPAMAREEYQQAKESNVPVLAYVTEDALRSQDSKSALTALYNEVRSADGITEVSSWDDIPTAAARAVYGLVSAGAWQLNDEIHSVAVQHDHVVNLLYARDIQAAQNLNRFIFEQYGEHSPRAHFNQACIHSLMSELASEDSNKKDWLLSAKHHFERSLDYGLIDLVQIQSPEETNVAATVSANRGIRALISAYPELRTYTPPPAYTSRLGGGCVEGNVPVSMADGRSEPIKLLNVGDKVLSWDDHDKVLVEGTVESATHIYVSEVLVINGKLKLTREHPILLSTDWRRAGELCCGDEMVLANGQFDKVETIEALAGTHLVVNISIAPTPTFVIHDVVVHNK